MMTPQEAIDAAIDREIAYLESKGLRVVDRRSFAAGFEIALTTPVFNLPRERTIIHHRTSLAEVEATLQRYRELMSDPNAKLTVEQSRNTRQVTLIFQVANSRHLETFKAWGTHSAKHALDLYCKGVEDGRKKPP